MASSNKHICSYFWSYYNWLNTAIIETKLKQYIKETHLYHHTFVFFMCNDLSFINTTKKFWNPPKNKKLNSQDGWEKTSYQGISREGYRQKHEMQVASKKVYWKNNRVLQTPAMYCHWKDIFSQLNRCIFQICLEYIKLVIPKILFILVLSTFNFYLCDPPPTKIKIPDPPAKTFLEFLPPSPPPQDG